MKIAITGSTGLIGSRFADLFKDKHKLFHVNLSSGADITDRKALHGLLSRANPSLILHLAAKTNVDGCEKDKNSDITDLKDQGVYVNNEVDLGSLKTENWKDKTTAFAVNVVGTKNLADWARENNVKIIYVSTDFVFDGGKEDLYEEIDDPNPINWYGQTKLWGEKSINDSGLIVRPAYPFGYKSLAKKDFIWTIIELLETRDSIKLISDQIITPTFIEDIAMGIDFLIEKGTLGIVNLVGNDFLSPYEIGMLLAQEFSLNKAKIGKISMDEFYSGSAKRPFKVRLQNDKLRNLGFEMTDFYEALKKISSKSRT
ncbi:MAG: hypothetical protein A3C27_02025 [Candidatus Levybacteria bacterium RIFCSPHIGHO2_02_FULL_39_36]|nr:MAG: hypothetical protein A3C27_02025 [Candidatus Levybacteria bacterium RIFCSPHIGHO2_02_FULL_39_36]OGH45715.1 MAG: hypothetical protein A3H82_03525 [Candidatus Levybacteria bacterium RIFCSPLOWO2_02_FULL_39_26]OGH48481.1 MAG: hypothetical protein A3G66_00665 [Candidatus Levybacteria bacterium RIFCSPLOWO2_12_FULL_39_17]